MPTPSRAPRRRPRTPRRTAAGVLASVLVLLPGALGTVAPASAAPASDAWWYDALGVGDVHKDTRGAGATVLLVDGTIDTSVPDLADTGIELTQDCRAEPMESYTEPDAEHGTWMAALIKGSGSGPQGIAGVAPEADLKYFTLDLDPYSDGIACKSSALPLLEDLVESVEGGPILSLSVGNLAFGWDDFQDVVEKSGGVAVASAGDYTDAVGGEGMMDLPAGFAGYVAVLALDEKAQPWRDNPLPYKVLGKYRGYPTIAAPGVDIPGYTWRGNRFVAGEPQEGTSPATALVAGSLALVRAKYPEATGNQLIQHMIHFDQTPGNFTYDDAYGFGIISLRNMMANDPTLWPDVNPLLEGNPKRVLQKFPSSIYGDGAEAEDPDAAGPEQSEQESDPASAEDSATDAAGATEESGSGSGSVLPWVAGGVVVLLIAAGATVLARRGKTNA